VQLPELLLDGHAVQQVANPLGHRPGGIPVRRPRLRVTAGRLRESGQDEDQAAGPNAAKRMAAHRKRGTYPASAALAAIASPASSATASSGREQGSVIPPNMRESALRVQGRLAGSSPV